MDRRSFVGVLTGAPTWLRDSALAKKLAPDITLPDDDDVSPWLAPSDLAVYGRQKAFSLHANNETASMASISLKRLPEDGGHTLYNFGLAPGHGLTWTAEIGREIYGPIRIVTPKLVQAFVIGTNSHGHIVMASKDGVLPLERSNGHTFARMRRFLHRLYASLESRGPIS